MDIEKLEGTGILSISLDQPNHYFEMVVCTNIGRKFKVSAWNAVDAFFDITFGALDCREFGAVGELECVTLMGDVLILEGNFVNIVIKTARILIEEFS
ncbi:hypothetical protein [Massilia litorea]|jgi:hypothetical protein|uniref:Uncharacterized protein n=1 Tax=Massilia litorea TaxID=2769491 RepID=A0A7L9UB44_9BURK|nr:hypothetical protein [Massilia litorea]QOL52283.1 hypothetical protein LPB04_23505 [Massilia litorea]